MGTTSLHQIAGISVSSRVIQQETQGRRLHTTSRRFAKPMSSAQHAVDDQDLATIWTQVEDSARSILEGHAEGQSLPDEKKVLKTLRFYNQIARRLLQGSQDPRPPTESTSPGQAAESATSALLHSADTSKPYPTLNKPQLLQRISLRAISILEQTAVSISPELLKTYISLQSKLNKPQSFAHILTLYRTKSEGSARAVDSAVASQALEAAIRLRDLPLCLSIVEQTYADPAFARQKLIKSAVPPATAAALVPVTAYLLARQFALVQDTMDQGMATGVAMAGMVTYAAVVATMGYVTITTSNDQMKRVTWATGLPLWERWAREEERAATEAIAMAWGFKKQEQWGDEDGGEWCDLKEWAGVRGMVLDRVNLMEGME